MRRSRGGGIGDKDPPPPKKKKKKKKKKNTLENHKAIGVLSNTGLVRLENNKASKPDSMLGHHRPTSETPFNDGPLLVVFGSSFLSSIKIKQTKKRLT